MKRRRNAIAACLARITRSSHPEMWRVRCVDQDGHRAVLRVTAGSGGVVLHLGPLNRLSFAPLSVGRLRNALRDALVIYSEIRSADSEEVAHARRPSAV